MIRVRDLHKVYPTRFGEKLVLDGVSFDLAPGEKLGILGRNGAGKSTMVRLVSGAEKPTSGTIERGMSVSWPLAFGGAFQPQLTGIDNVRFITRIYDQDFDSNLAFVEEFAELGPYLREPVSTYSSGMRARLAFAISMIIEFDCFLIDEISAVGDARFHHRCNHELFEKRGDRAMIIISHDAAYLRDHCTRFAVLHDAQLHLFQDMDTAYACFREKIGLEAEVRPTMIQWPQDRAVLIETTHTVAVLDDAFKTAVQQADWHRDAGDWGLAEEAYSAALQLYPYQRSYWVQKGHCAKEAGADVRAEAAYRTAIALGENAADVREHLDFVLQRQGVTAGDHPAREYVSAAAQHAPPGLPDIMLLQRAVSGDWLPSDDEQLRLLRTCETCDDVLAHLLNDDALARGPKTRDEGAAREELNWVPLLLAISHPHYDSSQKEQLADAMRKAPDLLKEPFRFLASNGGFPSWNSVSEPAEHAA